MSKTDKSGVYQILCAPTGKSYVGSSVRIYARWYNHRFTLNRGGSYCSILQRAWNKYGEQAFRFSILEECERDVLQQREQHYLNQLRPQLNIIHADRRAADGLSARYGAQTHCQNGHPFADGNAHYDQAGRRVCRTCKSAYDREYLAVRAEKRATEEAAAKAARLATRRAEQKEKYRLAKEAAGETLRPLYGKGVPCSEEQRAKISATLKAKPQKSRAWETAGFTSRTSYYRHLRLNGENAVAEREKLRAEKRLRYHANGDKERATMRERYYRRKGEAAA